jgi:hypothetical protein
VNNVPFVETRGAMATPVPVTGVATPVMSNSVTGAEALSARMKKRFTDVLTVKAGKGSGLKTKSAHLRRRVEDAACKRGKNQEPSRTVWGPEIAPFLKLNTIHVLRRRTYCRR